MFVNNYLTVFVRDYFWPLYSFPWSMSAFMLIPHFLNYCSFVISFEIRKCESSKFVPLFQDAFVFFKMLLSVSGLSEISCEF